MDEQTVHEERMWDHYKALEAENYHLKKQLLRKNDQIRGLKASYSALNYKYKKLTENKKQRFINKKR